MQVFVDGRCRLPYAAYVLQGMLELGHTLRFRRLDSPDGDGLAMKIGGVKVWVDTNDMAEFDEAAYDWCDVFGKVNCAPEAAPSRSKVCLLGPLFGVRLWNLPAGYLRAPGLVAAGKRPRSAIADLRFQGITRLPIGRYIPATSQPDFIFHVSRAWSGKHAETNSERILFVDAVDALGVPAETRFTEERMPLDEYLVKIGRSTVAFNSPAVHRCLGWKLGEYLALGKAIISTPLERALPAPLEHGVHVHFTPANRDEIAASIDVINRDQEYRAHLEQGARRWFEANMTPAIVAERLLERSGMSPT
jgi:hypothetical protein